MFPPRRLPRTGSSPPRQILRRASLPRSDRANLIAAAGRVAHRDNFGAPTSLPASFVIDREGRVVEQRLGRLPPDIWDRIADLMP